jgi:ABC-2 type transport system permease protein
VSGVNVIGILWWRQLLRYGRSRARILATLAQPLLFLVSFGFGFGPVFAQAGRGNYLQYLAPGVIGMGVLFSAVFSGIELIWDRQFGFIKETLVAPVPRYQVMLGRTLGGANVAMLQGLAVALMCTVAGFRAGDPLGWLLALLFMALIAVTFTAVGTMIASVVADFQAFPLVMNFLVMPLFFLSGALFPLQGLATGMHWVTRFNPLSYGMDGLRGALTGSWQFGFATDVSVLLVLAVVAVIGATLTFSKIEA